MFKERAARRGRAATVAARLAAVAAIGYLAVGLIAHLDTPRPTATTCSRRPSRSSAPPWRSSAPSLLGRVPGRRVLQLMTAIGCFACVFAVGRPRRPRLHRQ